MNPPDPQELARRASERDPEAFGQLYEEHLDTIYRFVTYKVSDPTVGEDLTAEVFTKAWESIHRYQYRDIPFHHWLIRIARNMVIDYWRANKRTLHPLDEMGDTASGETPPDEQVLVGIEGEALRRAIAKLPDEMQTVILLRFVENFSHADVAKVLEKSDAAVRQIQVRALRQLKKLLEDEGQDPGVERGTRGPRTSPRPKPGPA
jgi:RNA polymerase sigma-70 factor, ECF subfamily